METDRERLLIPAGEANDYLIEMKRIVEDFCEFTKRDPTRVLVNLRYDSSKLLKELEGKLYL